MRRAMSPTNSAGDEIVKALNNINDDIAVPLGDVNTSIAVGGGRWRKASTALTASRSHTLATTGAAAGDQIEITRTDNAAFTCLIINGGPGAGTLVTLPASKASWARFQFDGTNWALRSLGTI